MALLYTCKVFSGVINDSVNTYFSNPALEELLATAENFCVQVNTSGVSGVTPQIQVQMSSSMDTTNWTDAPGTAIKGQGISNGAALFGYDTPNISAVPGRRVRYGAKLTGSGARAYVEIWVTGRDGY